MAQYHKLGKFFVYKTTAKLSSQGIGDPSATVKDATATREAKATSEAKAGVSAANANANPNPTPTTEEERPSGPAAGMGKK